MNQRSMAQAIRQNHGIEHATVTLLSERYPGAQLVARSDATGFHIFGAVDTQALRETAEDALARLQHGQSDLAVHPFCGTNLVTAGILSGLAAMLAGSGRNRAWYDRAPGAVLGATLALFAAIPAGRWVQRNVTTSSHVDGLRIAAVERLATAPVIRHRVTIA